MVNRRIVLNTKDFLLYTGIEKQKQCLDNENGVLIELDSKSGLKLWCPEYNIESLLEVDIVDERPTTK